MNGMTRALPNAFCQASHYYRQCFSVTAQECEDAVISSVKTCLNKNNKDIPSILMQPRDGTLWGAIINVCTSRAYEATFTKNRIHNKKCDNQNYWQ